MKRLVEGSLGGDSGPAGISSRAETCLSEALQRDRSGPVFVRNEAQFSERTGWPAFGPAAGRFGHDKVSVDGQQGRRAFGRHGWRPEAPGHNQISLAAEL